MVSPMAELCCGFTSDGLGMSAEGRGGRGDTLKGEGRDMGDRIGKGTEIEYRRGVRVGEKG